MHIKNAIFLNRQHSIYTMTVFMVCVINFDCCLKPWDRRFMFGVIHSTETDTVLA